MKFYLSAPYALRSEAQAAVVRLTDTGWVSTARWITQDDSAVLSHEWAQADLDDVRAADVLVALNPSAWRTMGTGGRHAELGAALILNIPVVLVGERSNIFHYHHLVTVCETLNEVTISVMERIGAI